MKVSDGKKYILNQVKSHKRIFENFSWLAIVEVFGLLAPLITWPYLTKVLGRELYGYVLMAQMLMTYAVILIEFGTDSVCAKHVSIHRNDKTKLSEIVCSVLSLRLMLWVVCFAIYMLIVYLIPVYRKESLLFFLTYFMTAQTVLFPRYFYQGIEYMKMISLVNIFIRLFFIAMVFIVVKNESDYLLVPLFYAIGYTLAGAYSLWYIFSSLKIPFVIPSFSQVKYYAKDSLSLLATNLICTIKDKFNYQLLGIYVGMSDVVIYDLALKLNGVAEKPTQLISNVLFPKFAQIHDTKKLNKVIILTLFVSIGIFILLNVFLKDIALFFLHEQVDLLPIRLLSLAPVILSVSMMICFNYFIARGMNKYVFYSIITTTIAYLIALGIFLLFGNMKSIYTFVALALIAYIVELLYRSIVYIKNTKEEILSNKVI